MTLCQLFIRYSGKKVLVTFVYFGIGDCAFAQVIFTVIYACCLNHPICTSILPNITIIGTYGVTKNNPSGNFLTIYWIQTQYILLLGELVLTIFLCIKRIRFNWNFIVNDVQSATYSSHGAPCPARDLFPWLNTRVKVHISLWTIRKYPKRHFRYLSDKGDTFLPLIIFRRISHGSITQRLIN